MNPLLKIRLNWWETYIVSHLFGSDWQNKIWNNIVVAFDKWLEINANPQDSAIQSFVTNHLSSFIAVFAHANPFLAAAVQTVIQPLLSSLVTGLVAYLEAKLSTQAASAPSGTQAAQSPGVVVTTPGTTPATVPGKGEPSIQSTQGQTAPRTTENTTG